MHYSHETFVPAMRGYTDLRLRKDADPQGSPDGAALPGDSPSAAGLDVAVI